MITKDDTLIVDTNKTALLEIRGIIDGVLESGSTDYKGAMQEIAATANEACYPTPTTESILPPSVCIH